MATGAWEGPEILVVKKFFQVCVLLAICITSILARAVLYIRLVTVRYLGVILITFL